MDDKIKIILLGLGTVGSGVYELIKNNSFFNSQIEITKILVKDLEKKRDIDDLSLLTTDIEDLFLEQADIMIETLGGIYPAYELTKRALSKGYHVISSNKELVNTYFYELLDLAKDHSVSYLYEASVLAGIPIIKTLHEIILNDEVLSISGIFNGSTNYCLTRLFKDHYALSDALNEAQALGFLEADPKDDLEAYDALRKIMILSKIAFHIPILESDCIRRGIDQLSDQFINFVAADDFIIKLVAEAIIIDQKLMISVEPMLLNLNHPFAQIDDEMNIVIVDTKLKGKMTLTGQGAGKIPTAQGILADILLVMNHENYQQKSKKSLNLEIVQDQMPAVYYIEMIDDVFLESMIDYQEGLLIKTKRIPYDELKPFLENIKFYAKVA